MCLLRAFSPCISSCRPEGSVSGWQWFRRQVYGNSTHIKNPMGVEGRLCFSTHMSASSMSTAEVAFPLDCLCLPLSHCCTELFVGIWQRCSSSVDDSMFLYTCRCKLSIDFCVFLWATYVYRPRESQNNILTYLELLSSPSLGAAIWAYIDANIIYSLLLITACDPPFLLSTAKLPCVPARLLQRLNNSMLHSVKVGRLWM